MSLDLLRAMKVYRCVVELGSFARAADKLDMSRAMVSHWVAQLEAHLGTRLLHRTTRRLALTEEGREYFDRCAGILAQVEEAASAVSGATRTPSGVLRVNTAAGIVSCLDLHRLVSRYLQRYPQVGLQITLADQHVNFVDAGIDIALRFAEHVEAGLVARKIARIRMLACAAPANLVAHGEPRHPDELGAHNCLTFPYGRWRSHWDFQRGKERVSVPVSGRLRAGGGILLVQAALDGLGIVTEPEPLVYQALREGRLRRVLADWESPCFYLYAVHPQSAHQPAKVQRFVELLREHVGDPPYWERDGAAR